jgi:hypothetical protein
MEKLYAIGGVSLNKLEEAKVNADLAASEWKRRICGVPGRAFWETKTPKWASLSRPQKKLQPS